MSGRRMYALHGADGVARLGLGDGTVLSVPFLSPWGIQIHKQVERGSCRDIHFIDSEGIHWDEVIVGEKLQDILSNNFETVSERLNQSDLVAGSHLLGGEHE